MGWLIVMAGVVVVIPIAVAATSMQRRIYLRWISGWIGRDQRARPEVKPATERLLSEALPGGVVGFSESDFSGDGFVTLVESGVRLTQRPTAEKTTWGAFWPEVTGYLVLREIGALRIEVSGCGYVQVDTKSRAVQDHWESVLGMNGVPLNGSDGEGQRQ